MTTALDVLRCCECGRPSGNHACDPGGDPMYWLLPSSVMNFTDVMADMEESRRTSSLFRLIERYYVGRRL